MLQTRPQDDHMKGDAALRGASVRSFGIEGAVFGKDKRSFGL